MIFQRRHFARPYPDPIFKQPTFQKKIQPVSSSFHHPYHPSFALGLGKECFCNSSLIQGYGDSSTGRCGVDVEVSSCNLFELAHSFGMVLLFFWENLLWFYIVYMTILTIESCQETLSMFLHHFGWQGRAFNINTLSHPLDITCKLHLHCMKRL